MTGTVVRITTSYGSVPPAPGAIDIVDYMVGESDSDKACTMVLDHLRAGPESTATPIRRATADLLQKWGVGPGEIKQLPKGA